MATKLYILISVWMTLTFAQGHKEARIVQLFCKVALSCPNIQIGWSCKGGGGGGFQKRPVSVVIMDYFSNCSSSCEKRQKYWLVFRHLCTHFFQTHFMDSYYYRTVLCHFEWSWPAFKITGYVQVKTLLMHSSGREIRTNKSCNSQANIDC